ncbi:MAG: hypothetical protein EOL87_06270 [Spartobacteria bacterium]|nr:hypothetical protein [Spartobacteria bacterium]
MKKCIVCAGWLCWMACAGVVCAAEAEWTVWKHCRLVPNESANDGDSFWINNGSRDYKVRLYFVDTPESEKKESWAAQRLLGQAEYFGVSGDKEYAYKKGVEAKRFTQKLLDGQKEGFTVYTRFRDAMGRGKGRYYAMIEIENKYLSEYLVEKGLARLNKRNSITDPLPDGQSRKTFERHLRLLEREAKQQGLGGWEKRHSRLPADQLLKQRQQHIAAVDTDKLLPFVGRVVSLRHTTVLYSTKNPAKRVLKINDTVRVKIMAVEDNGMLRVRCNPVEGKIYEALCKASDLELR